jgi:hypothetical protein
VMAAVARNSQSRQMCGAGLSVVIAMTTDEPKGKIYDHILS